MKTIETVKVGVAVVYFTGIVAWIIYNVITLGVHPGVQFSDKRNLEPGIAGLSGSLVIQELERK